MWWRGYPFRITLHNTIFSDELSQKCVRTVGTTAGVRDDGCSGRGGEGESSGESVLWLFPTGFKGGGLVYSSGQMKSSASSPCYVFENGEGMASSWSQGTIGVHGADGVDIQVVDLRGVVRYMGKINENRFLIEVPSGVYMVRIGEHVERVVVP